MRLPALLLATLMFCGCAPQPPGSSAPGPAAAAQPDAETIAAVRQAAIPLRWQADDYEPLIASIAGASRILLGESTHGTHEYYRERARITMQLIRDAGVNGVAIEGDWSPTYRLNLYVRGMGRDRSAAQALGSFTNFPKWMWPNAEFAEFVEQLRAHNMALPEHQRVGLYGMDVYDLFEAADAVVSRLQSVDAAAAARVKSHYRCFSGYGRNTGTYGEAARQPSKSCREEATAALQEVSRAGLREGTEDAFSALRAAASVAAAEEYFRTLHAGVNAWNFRDRRMHETVEAIAGHVQKRTGRAGKVVMWSHNSHSGDARATSAAQRGELNLGQLMKQSHRANAYTIGFFTRGGTVFAAAEWDRPGRSQPLRPALPQSHSGLFHATGIPAFLLLLRDNEALKRHFAAPHLQRAVGVIYVPEQEGQAHYFDAVLGQQFDAAIFIDRTEAVRPI